MQMIRPEHDMPSPTEREEDGPVLESQDLLDGHSIVRILHRGMVYRLRATRQGKLLLTK